MKDDSKFTGRLSRRHVLSLLGIGLIAPGYGLSNHKVNRSNYTECEQDQILLTPEGKPVKIKSKLDGVKLLEKRVSNKSLLNWLKGQSKKSRR